MRKAGASKAPYDHTQLSEDELFAAVEDAKALLALDAGEIKSRLTPMRVEAMARLVRLGVAAPVAATVLRLDKETIRNWAAVSRQHLAEGHPPGFGEGESPFVYWLQEIDSARATHEASLVSLISRAAQHDWKAAAWLLERRYSKRYHLTSKLELQADAGKKLEITSYSTDRLLQLARGLLPEEDVRVVHALPEDTTPEEP